ncbi:MAG: VOC family protein [Verrucomicrobiota bacterium]|nr:VOC family protein [Verrucomicrobiota bacterium]
MKNCLFSIFFVISSGFTIAENFSSQTIDLGVVVTDIEKSLEFYKEVVGFTEDDGFDVTGDFPKKVGLTDGTPLKIHVLTLGEDETATKLKLMQVSSSKPTRKIKQPYIHTLSGFSYLTIFVKDVDLVLSNANKKGYKAYANSPQTLPKGLPQNICLLMLKDPDGNFVEIVGPNTKALQGNSK